MRREFTDIGARPLAIMVRFPGQLFDTTPPPMALLNQSLLIISIGSDYTDFDTDLEAEADVNEEGNEDCSAVL